MISHIKYRIGKYITGPMTFKFSSFKPNSAGSYKMRNQIPEYALETWKIISNLIDERYESQIIKTRHFYVFLVKKCK